MRNGVFPLGASVGARPRLPFTAPWLLAPMEGVTEPCFRGMVLARNSAACLGGAFTEFVRIVSEALPPRILRAHLGPERFEQPVGLQLMGTHLEALAETARRAVAVGAPLVDLNFGCPARGALRGCAGSALLDRPRDLERIVATCARAVPETPVTAKIRAGIDDASMLEELAQAAEAGGAALLTVHCRTRREGYQAEVDWTRIARAVTAVSIPVCGNGAVSTRAGLERMRAETGCAYVMVGRGALADPWFFSGVAATRAEAARFLLEYAARLQRDRRSSPRGAVARLKQMFGYWQAGGLVTDEDRKGWLRMTDETAIFARLNEAAASEDCA